MAKGEEVGTYIPRRCPLSSLSREQPRRVERVSLVGVTGRGTTQQWARGAGVEWQKVSQLERSSGRGGREWKYLAYSVVRGMVYDFGIEFRYEFGNDEQNLSC